MTARIIDGSGIASEIRAEVAKRVVALTGEGVQPGLAAVVVGDDRPSHIYVGAKRKACADAGIYSEKIELPAFVTEAQLLAEIRRLTATRRSTASSSSSRSRGTCPRSPRSGRSTRARTWTVSTR